MITLTGTGVFMVMLLILFLVSLFLLLRIYRHRDFGLRLFSALFCCYCLYSLLLDLHIICCCCCWWWWWWWILRNTNWTERKTTSPCWRYRPRDDKITRL